MLCNFFRDGEATAAWTEERTDLPLYQGDTIDHDGEPYELLDDAAFVADWDSCSVAANIVVKAEPTKRR
jgi:hypothetical protein